MQLSPEQFGVLKDILSEPAAKAAAVLNLPMPQLHSVLAHLTNVLKLATSALGGNRLLIRYESGQSGGQEMDGALIRRCIRDGTAILHVGDDGHVTSTSRGAASGPAAATLSEAGPSLCCLSSSTHLSVFAGGKYIAEIVLAGERAAERLDWKLSWRELPTSLDLHFEECVDQEKHLRYWADKPNRILLAGPDGTEKLFHHDLFWWCDHCIADAISVFGESQSMGQDKTDITIVTEVGSIVIEVKWLGKNENGTSWAEVRIHEGMIQVADYLQRDRKLIRGYLVLYDARSEDDNHNRSSYPKDCRHERCEEPIIYFLRSETPSARATRLAAQARHEQDS
jgi:hypothetical protein